MKLFYERFLNVNTPDGSGIIVRVNNNEGTIKYTVCFDNGKQIEYCEVQVEPLMCPNELKLHGKLLESEMITSVFGEIHSIYVYEYKGEMWYMSLFKDTNNDKHLKALNKIGEIPEC